MTGARKMLFGAIARGVPEDEIRDAADDVLDAIEEAGISDDDWDWIAWHSKTTLYMVIYGPLSLKSALVREDWLRIMPPVAVSDKMLKQSNTWVYPKTSKRLGPAQERAEEMLLRWQSEQWQDEHHEEAPRRRSAQATPVPSRSISRKSTLPDTKVKSKAEGDAVEETRPSVAPTPEPEPAREPEHVPATASEVEGASRQVRTRAERAQQVEAQKRQAQQAVLGAFGLLGAKDSEGKEFKMFQFAGES